MIIAATSLASPFSMASLVIRPLLDVTGPRPGSIQVLVRVMEAILIRHAGPDLAPEILDTL